MTREDHEFEVQRNAAKLMTKIFYATLLDMVNPGKKTPATPNFYANVVNHIATYGMSVVPFAELSSSASDCFVPSS